MKKLTSLAVAAIAVVAIPSTVAAHKGPPVAAFTDTGTNTIIDAPFEGCGGVPGTVSVELRFRFHVTQFADGHFVISGADWGTFEFTPEVGRVSTGHYRNGGTEVLTSNSYVSQSVFVGVGEFDDGTRNPFHIRTKFTWANGEVRVDDMTVRCVSA